MSKNINLKSVNKAYFVVKAKGYGNYYTTYNRAVSKAMLLLAQGRVSKVYSYVNNKWTVTDETTGLL